MKQRQYKTNIITRRLRLLVFVFLPLFALNLALSLYISSTLREQTEQYLVNTVELYSREIDDTIARINRRMGQILVGQTEESRALDVAGATLLSSGNEVDRLAAIKDLQGLFYELSMEYGEDYNFFLYLPPTRDFVRGTQTTWPARVYRAFSSTIMEQIDTDTVEYNSGRQFWKSFSVEDMGSCIMKVYRRGDFLLGCWILAEDLISPLEDMDFGRGGFAVLTDEEDTYLTGQAQAEEYGLRLQRIESSQYRVDSSLWTDHLIIEQPFENAPFHVKLLVSQYGVFDKVLIFQLLLLGLALGIFTALLASSLILNRQVLAPLRRFSDSLAELKQGNTDLEGLSNSELYELEQVNDEFRRLFKQIKWLEIEVYKRELERQDVQLKYLQLQVKPHFYINCLNFIYNMVDMGDVESAKRMSRVTSDYLRYLFKNGMDRVSVEEELAHVDNYLQILKMRYHAALDYYIEQDDATRGAAIPPMIIQTFVENSVKHGLDLEHPVSISVVVYMDTADDGQEQLVILVSDNGKGFPQQVLDGLRQRAETGGELTAGGVGIENSLKRLEYYYGGRAKARFSNTPGQGAVVQVELPLDAQPAGDTT